MKNTIFALVALIHLARILLLAFIILESLNILWLYWIKSVPPLEGFFCTNLFEDLDLLLWGLGTVVLKEHVFVLETSCLLVVFRVFFEDFNHFLWYHASVCVHGIQQREET